MKILVCGGRNFRDGALMDRMLDDLHFGTGPDGGPGGTQRLISCIVTGAARGADQAAECWARKRGIPYRGYPAPWETHGPWCRCPTPVLDRCAEAGSWRNGEMLRIEHQPVGRRIARVVAFPGGVGTADMVRRARAAGIEVMEIR